jgi:hypothetical protein
MAQGIFVGGFFGLVFAPFVEFGGGDFFGGCAVLLRAWVISWLGFWYGQPCSICITSAPQSHKLRHPERAFLSEAIHD